MKCRFHPGQQVRVDCREQSGHVRTPDYVKGRRGLVLEVRGMHPDPGDLAQGGLGLPYRYLYRVLFEGSEVWSDDEGDPLRLVVDVYENWLTSAETVG